MRQRIVLYGFFFVLVLFGYTSTAAQQKSCIVFYGDSIQISIDTSMYVDYKLPLGEDAIKDFYYSLDKGNIVAVVDAIRAYKQQHNLDDWIYYQVIRATTEKLSPKAQNYQRYTLYKWYFLVKSGYGSLLTITSDKILLHIQSDEDVYEIPTRTYQDHQYICLNYHDYGEIDFKKENFRAVNVGAPAAGNAFSYVIKKLPDFSLQRYLNKEINFDYYQRSYDFNILVNPDIQKIFANYPVLNYSYYFNMPMSEVTYNSLIPLLKKQLSKMDARKGVDYLMHFVRHAFNYKSDAEQFGKEKRLSAEQTLLYDHSDCEDRAAFFFYIVKEIYDLPMIVLCYPKHVTVAVNFGKKFGKSAIEYKGSSYYLCEPSSQSEDLRIGEMMPEWKKDTYQVVYEYTPLKSIAR